jgi:hypothetical protein
LSAWLFVDVVLVLVFVAVFVFVLVFECVLLLLLSAWLLVDVVFVFVALLVLLLLLSAVEVFVVLMSDVRVVVCVTVLPPRPTTESSACALSEKANEIAVTSKVLFIRIPLSGCDGW